MSVCFTDGVVVVTATFRLQAASLHQATVDWMSSGLYSTRWIVSCVNSFAYDLSAYLSDLLSPLTGLTSHTVPKSASFVQEIRSLSIHADETMVSFDVESLFTNVPIEGALNAALQRLSADTSLPARTSLSPSQVIDFLGFVLRATYFSYNGSFYEQQEGAAMGSPVSAVIANLYMEVFEEQALQSCDPQLRPRVWKRYVDDTFVISTRASVEAYWCIWTTSSPPYGSPWKRRKTERSLSLTPWCTGNPTAALPPPSTGKPRIRTSTSPTTHAILSRLSEESWNVCMTGPIVTTPNGKVSEKQHLASALVSNGYPLPCLQKVTKTRPRAQKEQANHRAMSVGGFHRHSGAASNNTAYGQYSNPTQLYATTWYGRRTQSLPDEMGWYTGSRAASATLYTSGRQEDQCRRGWRSTREMYALRAVRPLR